MPSAFARGLSPQASQTLARRLRDAEELLHRARHHIQAWERRYGDADPSPVWLPPGGAVNLHEDIASFLAE
jgi:hypothetical protein